MRFARLEEEKQPPYQYNPDLRDESRRIVQWDDIAEGINQIKETMAYNKYTPKRIVGIGRGGSIPATILAYNLGIEDVSHLRMRSYSVYNEPEPRLAVSLGWLPQYLENNDPNKHIEPQQVLGAMAMTWDHPDTLFVDDIWDSGRTTAWLRESFPLALIGTVFWKDRVGTDAPPAINFPGKRVRRFAAIGLKAEPVWYKMPWEPMPEGWNL